MKKLLVILLLMIGPGHAAPCFSFYECDTPQTVKEALRTADVVLLGTVVTLDGSVATVAVEKIWKGPPLDTVVVYPDLFHTGLRSVGRHLIYAWASPYRASENAYRTNICTRTAPADSAKTDIAILNGEAPDYPAPIYSVVEEMPHVEPSLDRALDELRQQVEEVADCSGRIVVEAEIDQEGEVAMADIVESAGLVCDAVVLYKLRQLNFQPGKQRGRPARVRLRLPIAFR